MFQTREDAFAMRVLTLNTWQERGPWERRWELILEGLRIYSPDVACFQELFNRDWAGEVRKKTGLAMLVFPKIPCGLVILTKYPVLDSGERELFKSPRENYSRGLLWAELEDPRGRILVLCTHLSWMPEDGESRKRQLAGILAFLREKGPRSRVLIAGDFNAAPDSAEIRWFAGESGFHDLYGERHPGAAGYTWDNRRNPYVAGCSHRLPDRRIDYIFWGGDKSGCEKPESCDIVFQNKARDGVFPSDHFGLLAQLF